MMPERHTSPALSLEEKVDSLPKRAGVYIMRDRDGRPLYIGKAKSLRVRLKSYLKGGDERNTIRFLMEKVADIECIVTDTEKEALILEDTLIKKHRPRYNINLKDDKTYVSLRIDPAKRFPRIKIVRRVLRDGARYFGPYSSAHSVRQTIKAIQEIFPLRTCSDRELMSRRRPCIDYEMKRCLAPCVGLVDEKTYRELVKEVILFLEGKKLDLLRILERKMEEASDSLNFEEAARIRDTIKAVKLTVEKQVVASYQDIDQDVIGIFDREKEVTLYILFIRDGRLIGDKDYLLARKGLPISEILSSFILQSYRKDRFIPDEIIIPHKIEDKDVLEEVLRDLKGKRVKIIVPKRGNKVRLLKMAEANAEAVYRIKRAHREEIDETLGILKRRLHLYKLPIRIEAVDISNISGDLAVGSIVVFENGKPDKRGYRHYRIKGVSGVDDYRMMYEVIDRRFRRIKEEGVGGPDLLLVDGGKGQLSMAMNVLKDMNISIDLVAISKGRDGKGDRFYIPGRKNPIYFKKGSKPYLFLQRVRDEAHRFAITYHRRLRSKSISSILDTIPGVGEKRRNALLKRFKGIEDVKRASLEELIKVPLIDRKTALNIYNAFHRKSDVQKNPA